MKAKNFLAMTFLLAIILSAVSSIAQSNPRYIQFSGVPNAVKGALYAPDPPQPLPHVGIVVMHRASNFMNALAARSCLKGGFSSCA